MQGRERGARGAAMQEKAATTQRAAALVTNETSLPLSSTSLQGTAKASKGHRNG